MYSLALLYLMFGLGQSNIRAENANLQVLSYNSEVSPCNITTIHSKRNVF